MKSEDEINKKIEKLEREQEHLKVGDVKNYLKLDNYIIALKWVNEYHDDDLEV